MAALDSFVLLREWQAYLDAAGRVGEKTRRQYLRSVIAATAIVLKPFDEWTPEDVQTVLRETTTRGGYRNQTLKALYSLFRYAARRHGFADPTEDFYIRRRRPGPPDYLTKDQLDALFSAAGEMDDPRVRPTLEFIYGSVARIHESTELRPEDIDVDHRVVRFVLGTKNDTPCSKPLGSRAWSAALQLLDLKDFHPRYGKRRPDKLIGVGDERVRQWMQKAGAAAGIDRKLLHPHILRHTALTQLANDPETSVAVIVDLANWSDPTPYRRYATAKQRGLVRAVSKL